jgi:hypothetical protein
MPYHLICCTSHNGLVAKIEGELVLLILPEGAAKATGATRSPPVPSYTEIPAATTLLSVFQLPSWAYLPRAHCLHLASLMKVERDMAGLPPASLASHTVAYHSKHYKMHQVPLPNTSSSPPDWFSGCHNLLHASCCHSRAPHPWDRSITMECL